MFSAGTRVYACSSAVIGKKLGPKRHSIGYVCDSGTAYHIKCVKNFPIKNQAFVFIPLKIVFTRYGKEERQRCETRGFLQILPIFKESKTQDIISGLTKQIISTLNGNELHKNTNWQELCANYIGEPTNIGTIMPIGHVKAVKMTEEDTVAWIISILKNKTFRSLIRANKHLHTLIALANDHELLVWLSNAVMNKKTRGDLLKWAKESQSNMRRLVEVLQRMNIAFNKRLLDDSTKYAESMLDKGNFTRIESYLTWLTDRVLDDQRILTKKGRIIQKATSIGEVYRALARNMESIRYEYLNLKPKYV